MKVPHESPTLTKHLPPPPRQGCPPHLSSSALCQPCPRFLPSTVAVCSRLHQSSAASSATSHRPTAASLLQHPSHGARQCHKRPHPSHGTGTQSWGSRQPCRRRHEQENSVPTLSQVTTKDPARSPPLPVLCRGHSAASHCCNPSIGDFASLPACQLPLLPLTPCSPLSSAVPPSPPKASRTVPIPDPHNSPQALEINYVRAMQQSKHY